MSLVSMFRCKRCKVRMFERDCAGHLSRHGVDVGKLTSEQVLPHFEQGPQSERSRPGDGFKPMRYSKKRSATSPAPNAMPDGEPLADDVDVNY